MSINPSADAGVSVAMELHGIEDDVVGGKRYRGTAVIEESGWQFTEAERRMRLAPEGRSCAEVMAVFSWRSFRGCGAQRSG